MATSPKITGTFTATGVSATAVIFRAFNVSVQGTITNSSVSLERSFDNGSTWEVVETYTAAVSKSLTEVEHGVLYRFNCTLFGVGSNITYRVGSAGLDM